MDEIEKLRQDFPNLYQKTFDLSIPSGWIPLIRKLSEDINILLGKLTPSDMNGRFGITQIKVKFGGLRVYYVGAPWGGNSYIEIHKRIQEAEQTAAHTCVVCGTLKCTTHSEEQK